MIIRRTKNGRAIYLPSAADALSALMTRKPRKRRRKPTPRAKPKKPAKLRRRR